MTDLAMLAAPSTVTTTPLISVVIPTYNRLSRLRQVLRALECQTCSADDLEVVVVSDGSTDGTNAYLATVSPRFHLVVVMQPNSGPAAARNRGIDAARGPLILFVDDDVVATPTLVEEHLASHRHCGGHAVVIGPMITPRDFVMRPWVAWEQAMLYKQYEAMNTGDMAPTSRQFYTGNASVGRALLVETGGFNTGFRRAEDVELSYRLAGAGVRFVWNPRAIGHHYADRSFDSWLQTARDYGRNEVVFSRDHRQDPRFERARSEWRGRNRFLQWLVMACVEVPTMESILAPLFRLVAAGAPAVGAPKLSRLAFSAVYNVAYYRGFARALGGAGEFRRAIVG